MRTRRVSRLFAILVVLVTSALAHAQSPGSLVRVDSARGGATIPVFVHAAPNAKATLILLPGGAGGIGRVAHHEKDACENCRPDEAGLIVRGLTNAPVKKLVMVNGGGGAQGNPCEPFHYHGYIGMEQDAVNVVAGWIRNPAQ